MKEEEETPGRFEVNVYTAGWTYRSIVCETRPIPQPDILNRLQEDWEVKEL